MFAASSQQAIKKPAKHALCGFRVSYLSPLGTGLFEIDCVPIKQGSHSAMQHFETFIKI
jgi:hypothetical protein